MRRAGMFLSVVVVLAACGSGGDTGDSMPQQPKSLERFAAIQAGQIAVGPGGVLYGTVHQQTLQGGEQQIDGLFSFSPDGQPSDRSVSVTNTGGLASDGKAVYFSETLSCVMHFCGTDAGQMATDGPVARLSLTGPWAGASGDVVTSGRLRGIAVDPAGNIYVADQDGVIRKRGSDGALTILSGASLAFNGGGEIDGKANEAGFSGPNGLAIDAAGNLYVTDTFANTIRKVTPDGVVTTLAGVAFVSGSMDGPAASATFNNPTGVAVDAHGNAYVADTGNALIRRISASGMVTTFAGTRGMQGFAPGPLPGTLDPVSSVAIYGSDLYFAMPTAIGRVRDIPAQ